VAGLFNWNARKSDAAAAPAPVAAAEPSITPSKVLPKFLAALSHTPSPVLVDVGGVVGANVAFFGERLSCRLVVEDLVALVEAHARRPAGDGLSSALLKQLAPLEPESVDGVMCWDLFDYLDRATSQALAKRIVGLLKKGGVLHGFFGTAPAELTHYTRFIVQGPTGFRQRPYPATPTRRNVLQNRDISKIFDGLLVAESVLLKSGTRETLLRKP
jgi:hypothetical protein